MLDSFVIEFDVSNGTFINRAIESFSIDQQVSNKIYWVHSNLNEKEIFNQLHQKLNLPSTLIQLLEQQDSLSKLIDEDDALTLQVQCLNAADAAQKISFDNLFIHLTPSFCFTASYGALSPVSELIKTYHKFARYAKTPCFILFLLLDNLVNDYAKALFSYEEIVDQMDLTVRSTHKNIYNKVMTVKKRLMNIKRYMISLREIVMRISGRKMTVISEQCRLSLYNLSNHAHMVLHEIDSLRDMLNSLLDQIDNMLMQRMSETMKILTAFAAIFLPLSLITGIYGMNFRVMPELEWRYGYLWALFLIVTCAFLLFMLFKKKKWLA